MIVKTIFLRAGLWAGCSGAALLLAFGCAGPSAADLQYDLQRCQDTVQQQKDQLEAQQATIDSLNQRLDAIRAIKPDDLKKIFYPEKLEIDSLSGGYSAADGPGAAGVVVYLRPLDREGDVLKVAGEIRIQLYDLAAAPTENLIGEYVIPVEQSRDLWYGKLMTYYYAVKCPWPHGPPKHSEITIRAIFVDYLTQRVISAQRTCNVVLPP